jgi:hypothetical protein
MLRDLSRTTQLAAQPFLAVNIHQLARSMHAGLEKCRAPSTCATACDVALISFHAAFLEPYSTPT